MNRIETYAEEVWSKALMDAEQDVMRRTATPPGGKKEDESLEQYVSRTRGYQDEAMARVFAARAELERLKPQVTYTVVMS